MILNHIDGHNFHLFLYQANQYGKTVHLLNIASKFPHIVRLSNPLWKIKQNSDQTRMPINRPGAWGTPLLSLCLSYRVHLLAVDFPLEPLVKLRFGSELPFRDQCPDGCVARRQKCSRTQVRSAFFPLRSLPSNKIHKFFKRLAIFSFPEAKLTPGNLMRSILKNFYHTWRPKAILLPQPSTRHWTRIMQLPSLPKMRGGGCVDVLWYFKRPTTKQIW